MKKILPPSYFLMALICMGALHILWPAYRYWSFPLSLIGVIPLIVGIVINLIADHAFEAHHTTVQPFETSTALITTFPFSFSRHPMYFGMDLMLIGVALLLGTISCVVPVFAFAYLMRRVFVSMEEQMLAEAFGEEWERYRARVRRWF